MRRERSKQHPGASQPRPARRIREGTNDTYATHGKLPDLTVCSECGALYREGRWTWAESAPFDAHSALCPACHRIQDDYPAGIVVIEGAFARTHREEIENLVRNLDERESAEHPLVRIFGIEESEAGLEVPTTDGEFARSIGRALHHAYRGELEQPGPHGEEPVRVRWFRD